jgi:LytS/YehU family sensor histidine kinase
LNLYLDIEKMRFGDRLQLKYRLQPEALSALMPSLLLQPLIENAIKYAIAPREQGGTIPDLMCIHAAGRTYVLRETMKALEERLDPRAFQRVHRSTIVNLQRVRRLRPHTNGEYFLTLLDGQEIKLSRSYRDRVDRLLR